MNKNDFTVFMTQQISRLAIHFRLPYPIESREGVTWLRDITEALYGQKTQMIEEAVTHLINNHKGRFPAIVEIRAAISECLKKNPNRDRKGISRSEKDYENLKESLAWLAGAQGQEALRDGWGADFAGRVERGEIRAAFCDPIQSRRAMERIAELVNPDNPEWKVYKPDLRDYLHRTALSIACRCRLMREKHLSGWDEKLEPYNDPAFAAIIRHGFEEHLFPEKEAA